LFRRPDSRIFKQKYVERTKQFFEKHGPRPLSLRASCRSCGRSLVLAGVGDEPPHVHDLQHRRRVRLGRGCDGCGLHPRRAIGEDIGQYLLPIIAVIIVLSILPPVIEMLRRRRNRTAATVPAADPGRGRRAHRAVSED
jgi:membrane-associated protein